MLYEGSNPSVTTKFIMKSIKNRLRLPIFGPYLVDFYTKSDCLIAKSYLRIVIGKRGPYVEFNINDLYISNCYIPSVEKWRLTSTIAFYDEYRTFTDYVKIYHQKKLVNYADYKIGLYYISPEDLYVNGYRIIE